MLLAFLVRPSCRPSPDRLRNVPVVFRFGGELRTLGCPIFFGNLTAVSLVQPSFQTAVCGGQSVASGGIGP
jgi:hypothetical protein